MSSIDTDSTDSSSQTEPVAEATTADTDDQFELAAQVELLTEENRRLREEYVQVRQSQYRATALGLGVIGAVAALAGLLIPDAREILLALGATGLFGGVLTYYLTPSQFVAADVGERVYTAGATNLAAVADELGLREEHVYVPGETTGARLYVPQTPDSELPDPDAHASPIIVDDGSRGLLLEATGTELFREFERALTGDLADSPTVLASQLTDALVEQFELAERADADLEAGRATVSVTDSAFGAVDRFDHPIPSFLAVGFAAGLERAVTLEVAPGDDRADWLVTCRWETEPEADDKATDAVTFDESETTGTSESPK